MERLDGTTADQSDSAFTWRGGLTYLFDIGLAPYVSYAESFLPVAGTSFGGTPFQPTTGRQYEVGIKYQPKNFDRYMTVAGFDLTQQNVSTADPNDIGFSIQTGAARARGIELEAKVALTAGLNLIADYTHVETTVTRNNDGDVGKQFLGTPSDLASVWADYTFKAEKVTGLGVAAGFRYVGPSFGDAANTIRVPGYALFDAAVRYPLGGLSTQLESWKIAVNATNLTDKRYVSQCGFFGDVCRYGYGRTVLATLGYTR